MLADPVVDLPHVVYRVGKHVVGRKSVVNREDRDSAELVCPNAGVSLVRPRRHGDEAPAMDMEDHRIMRILLLSRDAFFEYIKLAW